MSKKGYLSNDAAAFYGACLCEALHHLHSRNICHRDIKPENVLINSDGYIVLVDFGFSKIVLDKTFTTCGSPEYMAPEMLLGKGHTLSVDHYALGVLIYEMLVGQTVRRYEYICNFHLYQYSFIAQLIVHNVFFLRTAFHTCRSY